jgi:glutamate racemase
MSIGKPRRKQPEQKDLRKINLRINKVKHILQEKDKYFYNRHCHLFERLGELRQRFIDTINLKMNTGSVKPVKLFLVQHNPAFGPGQGALKFIKYVCLPKRTKKASLEDMGNILEKLILEQVESSAIDKSLYHALHKVKLGGASCYIALLEVKEVGDKIQTVPINLTKNEMARLSRDIGCRLAKYHVMGPYGYWPEPDNVTTDEQILNWVEDEALKTLFLKRLLTPIDKELFETLNKVHNQILEKYKKHEKVNNSTEILKTPYHDAALKWLKEWRATRRGEMDTEESVSKTSKVSKNYSRLVLRAERKYNVISYIAGDILAVKRLLAVMSNPFKDYRPNGQIVIIDTGIAPAIVHKYLSSLKELYKEDVVAISILSKRLGGSTPEKIERLCRIYTEAAYNLGAKIVLFCNTMDANARAVLSKEFSIPIIGPIEPAVEVALSFKKTNGKKAENIGIIATRTTIESGAYVNNIKDRDSESRVFSVVAPLLATIVDMCEFGKDQTQKISRNVVDIIEANIRPLMKKDIDVLILGCTHYGVFEHVIHGIWKRYIGKDIYIVNSTKELSLFILTYLKQNKLLSLRDRQKGDISYMSSIDDVRYFERGILEITGHTAEVIPMDVGEVVGRLSEEDRLFQKTIANESREDVCLRSIIIESPLSADAKVAIADKLYGAGSIDVSQCAGEILTVKLRDEYVSELEKLAAQNKERLKILSHIKNATLGPEQV